MTDANQQPTEDDIKRMAAHLRKPEGEDGIHVGELMNDGNAGINLHAIAVLHPKQGDSILEIGMGNGQFVKHIVCVDSDIYYRGIDYSDVMVEESIARNQNLKEFYDIGFELGTAHRMPYEDSSFDKVLTINTFYFWDDHKTVINEIKRVMRPKGSLIIGIRPPRNLKLYPVTAYNFTIYDKEQMTRFLSENGFEDIQVTEIREPDQELWGETHPRECMIIKAYKC